MSNTSVTYHYQFGVALDESGFNLVSAGLWTARPELFSYSTDIIVKPADPGPQASPAHVLTVYAVAHSPFSISLYPVAALPSLPQDSFLLQGDIDFSLTDSIFGTITKIGVTFQSQATVQLSNGNAQVSVLMFDLTDIRGEQPALVIAPASPGAGAPAPVDDGTLGRTFVAIVQYLSQLYLQVALEKAVIQFPVPRLDQIAGFGTLGALPVDGIYIRNKALYIDVGQDLGTPLAFPLAPAQPVDLRVGISTSGMQSLIGAFLPVPVPLELGNSGTTLHLTSSLVIPEIDFQLTPGATKIPVAVHLSGMMNLHVQVPIPILGGTFGFDVPIPIDPLTQYAGSVLATLQVDQYPAVPNAQIKLRITPDVHFFDDWYALVVTNYRNYLANAFQAAANNAVNQLVGSSFCNIPILGWIVCGTINVIAQVAGYLVGSVLDFWASTFLTGILNTIGRIVIQFFQTPAFNLLSYDQASIYKMLGTSVESGQVVIVANGRDADLEADLWFQPQGLPVPPAPQPVNPLPVPQPEPPVPYPAAPVLPVYGYADFAPEVVPPTPVWTDGQKQNYAITVQSAQINVIGEGVITFSHTGHTWQLRHTVTDVNGNKLTDAFANYDDASFHPLTSNYANINGTTTLREAVDFVTSPGNASASLGFDGQASDQYSVPLAVAVATDFDEFWIYRWAHGTISAALSGKFGRIGIVSPTAAQNWARETPVTVSIAAGTFNWAAAGGIAAATPVWVITASDEQNQIVAQVAKDGTGLLQMVITAGGATSTVLRQ